MNVDFRPEQHTSHRSRIISLWITIDFHLPICCQTSESWIKTSILHLWLRFSRTHNSGHEPFYEGGHGARQETLIINESDNRVQHLPLGTPCFSWTDGGKQGFHRSEHTKLSTVRPALVFQIHQRVQARREAVWVGRAFIWCPRADSDLEPLHFDRRLLRSNTFPQKWDVFLRNTGRISTQTRRSKLKRINGSR